MTEDEAKTWVVERLAAQSGVDPAEVAKRSAENYLEIGWIDSFGFIEFLSEMEDELGVDFDNDEFQDRGFGTADGLAAILAAKTSGAQS